jgi:hypothetical protein
MPELGLGCQSGNSSEEEKMRKYVCMLLCLVDAALFVPSVSAKDLTLVDAVKALSPGGNTIGGPGVFQFQPNQGVNVMDLSGAADSVCGSVLVISGTVEINLKDSSDVQLDSSIANATPGPGGVTAGATACANSVGLIEVRCSGTSTQACKGAWRVDKK